MSHLHRSSVSIAVVCVAGLLADGVRQTWPPTGNGAIAGVVFDSLVTNAPLAGAEVTLDGSNRSTIADRDGRFSMADVPSGPAVLRFYHPRLDSLGFGAAPVSVAVSDDRTTNVRLTTPSAKTFLASLCPGSAPRSTGVLLGVVRDVDARTPLPDAAVEIRWTEWTATKDGLVRGEGGGTTSTSANGTYAACGVPTDVPVVVRATAVSHVTGLIEVDLAQRLFAVRDLTVGVSDSGASLEALGRLNREALRGDTVRPSGAATVHAVVLGRDGNAVEGAQVSLFGFPTATRTGSDGSFTLSIPAGTQALEVRAIGYAAARLTFDLTTGERRDVNVRLEHASGQTLAPINIVGRGSSFDRTGFDRRRSAAVGEFITQEQIEKRKVFDATHLLWFVRGARPGSGGALAFPHPVGGGILQTGGVFSGNGIPTYCSPAYWVDGFFVGTDGAELNTVVRPHDIRGIEVYVEPAAAPAIYRRIDIRCGLVLIWTKPPAPKPQKP